MPPIDDADTVALTPEATPCVRAKMIGPSSSPAVARNAITPRRRGAGMTANTTGTATSAQDLLTTASPTSTPAQAGRCLTASTTAPTHRTAPRISSGCPPNSAISVSGLQMQITTGLSRLAQVTPPRRRGCAASQVQNPASPIMHGSALAK